MRSPGGVLSPVGRGESHHAGGLCTNGHPAARSPSAVLRRPAASQVEEAQEREIQQEAPEEATKASEDRAPVIWAPRTPLEKEVPVADTQDVWQLVEHLREELKRVEEETQQKFSVQTQVNHALTHLALSAQERADFLKDLESISADGALRPDKARRSSDAHARREALLTQFDNRPGEDGEELCSSRDAFKQALFLSVNWRQEVERFNCRIGEISKEFQLFQRRLEEDEMTISTIQEDQRIAQAERGKLKVGRAQRHSGSESRALQFDSGVSTMDDDRRSSSAGTSRRPSLRQRQIQLGPNSFVNVTSPEVLIESRDGAAVREAAQAVVRAAISLCADTVE